MVNYLTIAYRWGWINNHHYIVYCGPDETKAVAMAESETSYRGGKYGCVVFRFNDDGTEYEQIHYSNSLWGEEKLHHNCRIDMFEELGHRLHDYASGNVLWPDPENPGFMKFIKKRPPKWIKELVAEKEERAKFMHELMNGKKQETAAAIGKEGK